MTTQSPKKRLNNLWVKVGSGRWHFTREYFKGDPIIHSLCHEQIPAPLRETTTVYMDGQPISTQSANLLLTQVEIQVKRYPPLSVITMNGRETTFTDSDEEHVCLGCWEEVRSKKLEPGGVTETSQPATGIELLSPDRLETLRKPDVWINAEHFSKYHRAVQPLMTNTVGALVMMCGIPMDIEDIEGATLVHQRIVPESLLCRSCRSEIEGKQPE